MREIFFLKFAEHNLLLLLRLGEMAEWSIAAVLKTVEGNTSGGSNPSLSAKENAALCGILYFRATASLLAKS